MSEEPKRLVEVRLIVLVTVDLRHPELIEALKRQTPEASVAEVVANEVQANLDSVSYVAASVVSRL